MRALMLARIVPFVVAVCTVSAQTAPVALVRHAPVINGDIEGSIQQMLPESVTLNGAAIVAGDLFMPGSPSVRLNGKPAFGGTLPGTGATSPTNFTVTLNGGSRLGHLRTRTDAVELPTVGPPSSPSGSRNVSINRSSQSAGDFSTLRNLTLNGNTGQYSIPAGTYGDFTANGNGGFTLGVAGATQPAVYAFQHLTLNGNAQLEVIGPVVITMANGLSLNGRMGADSHPEWLLLRLATGGLTLNGNVTVAGYVAAPAGTVTINGNSRLTGGVISDRLVLNGASTLQLIDLPPAISLTTPADGQIFSAPAAAISLQAAAADADGLIAKVEFFANGNKIG
ncbi:MAG TPA: Ig-like domain-containing protein, partial [Opitutus sp.]|nr:Ig-like domain-containing protein [Opitutus sp.]